MSDAFTPAADMRRHIIRLVTEEEAGEPRLSGDFPSESGLDSFRHAEIWLPTRADAVFLATADRVEWYGLPLKVGLVPPVTSRISSADIRLLFSSPVSKIGAWDPNDTFAIYRRIRTNGGLEIKSDLKVPAAALAALPSLAELVLPQFSATYKRESKAVVVPKESVIRTISDGEHRLAWQLLQDPLSQIDPRQLAATVVVGLPPGAAPDAPVPMLTLEVECQCGVLHMRSSLQRPVDLSFRTA
jgi:hypothetical protein